MLEEKIMQDYKQAMKDKDSLRSSALSFLRAALKNCSIEKRKDRLSDSEVISVLKKQVKQRRDSIEQFRKGRRDDLVEKEERELEILKSYLPEEMSEQELATLIDEVIGSLGGDVSIKDMGRVMKEIMSRAAASVDGRLASDMVRERLLKNDSKAKTD